MSGKQAKKARRIASYAVDGAGKVTEKNASGGNSRSEPDTPAALTVVKLFSWVVAGGMVLVVSGRMSAAQLIQMIEELLKFFLPAFGLFLGGSAVAHYLPRRRDGKGREE